MEKLKTHPNDPDANLLAGRYHCLVRGSFDKGLPLLAKGRDPSLKAAAEAELAPPATPAAQKAAGDLWWDQAAKETTAAAADACKARAGRWYRLAEPHLTGLLKLTAQQRLATLPRPTTRRGDDTEETPPPPAQPAEPKITITSARWGGGRNWADVTERVKELVAGSKTFHANPTVLGKDPTPGWRKQLEIEYLKNDEKKKLTVKEDQPVCAGGPETLRRAMWCPVRRLPLLVSTHDRL